MRSSPSPRPTTAAGAPAPPFRVTRYDLDLNAHANNVTILRALLTALPVRRGSAPHLRSRLPRGSVRGRRPLGARPGDTRRRRASSSSRRATGKKSRGRSFVPPSSGRSPSSRAPPRPASRAPRPPRAPAASARRPRFRRFRRGEAAPPRARRGSGGRAAAAFARPALSRSSAARDPLKERELRGEVGR